MYLHFLYKFKRLKALILDTWMHEYSAYVIFVKDFDKMQNGEYLCCINTTCSQNLTKKQQKISKLLL